MGVEEVDTASSTPGGGRRVTDDTQDMDKVGLLLAEVGKL